MEELGRIFLALASRRGAELLSHSGAPKDGPKAEAVSVIDNHLIG